MFQSDLKSFSDGLHCRDSWEKRPVLVRRHKHRYNEGWFSTQELDKILREVINRMNLYCHSYGNVHICNTIEIF